MIREYLEAFAPIILATLIIGAIVTGFLYLVIATMPSDPCIKWSIDGVQHSFCFE